VGAKRTVHDSDSKATLLGGKTHGFDHDHDPRVPAQVWFQESTEGRVLFIVFYTQACRWSRCLGCNLPSRMSEDHVPYANLMAQVDHVFSNPAWMAHRESIRKVIVSNNGSVLDEVTFSSTALMYLLAKLNLHLPNLAVLCLETRPEYVDIAELELIARALAEGDTPTQLEIAIGFEVFDDRIRNEVFHKGLDLAVVEGLVRRVAPYGFRLKCYFMQKAVPGMSDDTAVADIHRAIDYLDELAKRYGVAINMHLNPTFAAAGTPLGEAYTRGAFQPPKLVDVARAARHAVGKAVTVYVGLSDEGLAVPGGSFLRPGEEALVDALETFNRTLDYALLDALITSDRGSAS